MCYNFLKFSSSPITTSQHYAPNPNPTHPTWNYMSFFFSKRVSSFSVTNGSGKGVSSDVLARQWNRMSFIKTRWLRKSIAFFSFLAWNLSEINLISLCPLSSLILCLSDFSLIYSKPRHPWPKTPSSKPRHPWPNKAKHSLFDLPRNPWPKTPSFASHDHEPPRIGWWGRWQEIVVVSRSRRHRLTEWLRRCISSFWCGWGWWCETVPLNLLQTQKR